MPSRRVLCLLICAGLCGCATEEVPPLSAPAVKKVPAPDETESKKASTAQGNEKSKSKVPQESPTVLADQPQHADYQPPFPDRENLFLVPRRSASHKQALGSGQESIELLGFANVQGPRVILSIDGNVVPIAEGGQEAGIEVISIQPPAVVLQRDRERWQATLEN